MKRYLPIVVLLFFGFVASAAKTYYFNNYWQQVNKNDDYTYRRVVAQTADKTYKLTDYYKTGAIYRTTTCVTRKPKFLADYRYILFIEDTITYFYEDGTLASKGVYERGVTHGVWTGIDSTGKPYQTTYNMGVVTSDTDTSKATTDSLIAAAENMHEAMAEPKFSIQGYLGLNMRYPAEAKLKKVEERIIVRFVVNEEGYVTDVGLHQPYENVYLAAEAMRVIQEMPEWKPGTQNGKPVKVYYNFPISFKMR